MKLFEKRAGKKTRGQTMVEFALILPVLLMTMYGVMEFGRLLFIFVTTASATREAARYAAAVGINVDTGFPYYNDCAGIRAAAQRVGILAGIQDSDVIIQYDRGPGTTPYSSCPAPGSGPELGDRIVVSVTGHFEPIVPIVPISIRDIQSVTARTIIRNVRVSENFIAPQIVTTQPPSPYVFFEDSQTNVGEDVGTVRVYVLTDEPVTGGPLTVEIGVIDVLEALGEGKDYEIITSRTIEFQDGDDRKYIDISIVEDSLFEITERIILYIRMVSNNNLGYPRLHVIRIFDNDSLPIVYFDPSGPVIVSESDLHLVVPVRLTTSGAPASVGFTATPLTNGPNYDYTPITGRITFPVDYSSDYRTAISPSVVTIFPLDDFIATGDREILLTLIDPINAELDIDDQVNHPYTRIITIVDDDLCSLSPENVQLSGTELSIDIENTGGDVSLFGINVEFTADAEPELTNVLMNGVEIWSGNMVSPAGITNSDWLGVDRTISSGTSERIILQFSQLITTINSMSLDFGCDVMNIEPSTIIVP
jgi:hypothetical protein